MNELTTETAPDTTALLRDAVATLDSVAAWLSRCNVEDEPYFDLAVGELREWQKGQREKCVEAVR